MGGLSRRGLWVAVLALLALAPGSVGGASAVRAKPATVGERIARPLESVQLPAPALLVTHGGDVADPFVLRVGNQLLLFSSQASFFGENVPLRVSGSLTEWRGPPIDALPVLPAWADDGFTWGPDVRRVGARYVLWFSAPLRSSGAALTKCIGEAVSRSPYGPYRAGAAPLVCQLDHYGSIDPRSFMDRRGRLWLSWKSDDNADLNGPGHSSIYVQRLSRSGISLLGSPVQLLTADEPWEGRIVEAPDMVYAADHYWLFYSGNWFNQPDYGIGVAECVSPTGPCVKPMVGPWLGSNAQGSGPGEESVFTDPQGAWLLYAPHAVDYQASTPRPVALMHMAFDQFGPYALAPTTLIVRHPPPRRRPILIQTPGLGPIQGSPAIRVTSSGLQENG
ncbi:MAG TPA: glycoside hydrolase family 43 protein [Acidimicrobiales bacterium]|nr:glycoside hydrolase family 43 protein [Acidimicrobiales bacterium]